MQQQQQESTNYHSNSTHFQHLPTTPPSTNCYHPRLRF